jgi:hypothetical protein
MHINDTVTDWGITITELVTPEHEWEPKRILNIITVKTLADLRTYFMKPASYCVARSLQYNVPQPKDPTTYNNRLTGRLTFTYQDRIMKPVFEFNNVNDFILFLQQHDHALLAKCVGYDKN